MPAPDRSVRGVLPAPTAGISRWRQAAGAAVALLGIPTIMLALAGRRDEVLLSTPLLLVLSVVVVAALIGGIRPALPAAVFGFLLLNFVFTEPYGTFDVHRLDQGLALVVYIATAAAVSVVVDVAARRQSEAARASAEALELSALAGAQSGAQDSPAEVLQRICDVFGLRHAAVVEAVSVGWRVLEQAGQPGGGPEIVVPVSDNRALQVTGRALNAPDQRVLTAFARAAVRATEGRVLAEQAAEAQRLVSIDQLRTALLAGVGHDLRTPLAGIKAAVSSLRAEDVHWTDAERAELLAVVETSADRLGGLVTNLLAASRLDAGVLSVDLASVDVEEIIGRGLSGLGDNKRVVVDLPGHLPLVQADVGLAERVIANLVDNALEHSGKGTNVLIAAAERSRDVVISVIDTGPGITTAQSRDLFAPFQRLGDRKPGGLGLGLSVARGFTEAMGGTLEAERTQGGGLTMNVRLPKVEW
ncbi:MAG: ATP-binding protein [Mycobacteriales bacterium]